MPLALVCVPAALVAAALLAVNAPADPGAAIGGRAMTLLAVYLVHILIWIALGLAVSARARTQGAALVVLLALWFANAFVMPPLAMAAAKWRIPSPAPIEFAAAIEDEKAAWPDWDARVDGVMERFLAGEFESTMAPANVEVVALLESEAEETALYERHFAALFDRYRDQSRLYERAAAIAPTLAARTLSMALAGTDDAHDRLFADAAARYRSRMLDTLNSELAQSGRLNTFDYVRGRDLWQQVPPFDYDAPGLSQVLIDRSWSVAVLAAWTLGTLLLAAWSVVNMRAE
jgi:ABC-2 type transport system permease protein